MTGLSDTRVVELRTGDSRLRVCPGIGGSIAGFTWRGIRILRETPESALQEGNVRRLASYPLVPWSNRIRNAQLAFRGETFALTTNFAPEPHAIHGVGWRRPWQAVTRSEGQLTLRLAHTPDGDWPFAFEAAQVFSVEAAGFSVTLSIRNTDPRPAPAGIGFHPFFALQPGTRLETVWDGYWETGPDKMAARWRPLPPESDFHLARSLDAWSVDNCYTRWSREARLEYPTHCTTITASPALAHIVCYTPASRDCIALEPVSHAVVSDCRTNKQSDCDTADCDAAAQSDCIATLAPGDQLEGTMTVSVTPA